MSDNLPALRATTAVAVPKTTSPASPVQYPQSGNWFLLAFVGVILAGSAAWGEMWAVAGGVGAGSAALVAAGIHARRSERGA